MASPFGSFSDYINGPVYLLHRVTVSASETAKVSKTEYSPTDGIRIVDRETRLIRDLLMATTDDLFPKISCIDIITAVSTQSCSVPVFSSTSDPIHAIWRIIGLWGRGIVALTDKVRLTTFQIPHASRIKAADLLGSMAGFEIPKAYHGRHTDALKFARAFSEYLHTMIRPEELVCSWEFTLQVSCHSA